MKFYVWTNGVKKVTISNSGGFKPNKVSNRRISSRSFLTVLILLAIVLPWLFFRVAFLVLESRSACDSPLDCIGWRFFGRGDTSLKLREELTRAFVEAKDSDGYGGELEGSIASFNDLVKDITLHRQDVKTFAFKTKAMLTRMERKVQTARQRELIYWHLVSHGIPKSLHCLCLKLAEEYSVNAMARSRLPSPEYISRLADPFYHHVVLLTDNIVAASVVISSAVQNADKPEKLVFHIVTDKKTYTPMHAWFAINSVTFPVVEIKGLHQYDWPQEINVRVKEMLEIHRLIWRHHYNNIKKDYDYEEEHKRCFQASSPSCVSLMNHLRIYIHELFPDLNKIVFLDDDVVVQHDLSSLWDLDLNGKVVGAVVDSWCGENCCPGRKYSDFLNFSHSAITSNFDPNRCAWLYGMNVFDLDAWRRTNIAETYLKWLKLSLNSGLELWQPGVLPPALLAFEGHVHPLHPKWHAAGLGYRSPELNKKELESAAVIHFSGPGKPWLEISNPEVRSLWTRHVNASNRFIRTCRVVR